MSCQALKLFLGHFIDVTVKERQETWRAERATTCSILLSISTGSVCAVFCHCHGFALPDGVCPAKLGVYLKRQRTAEISCALDGENNKQTTGCRAFLWLINCSSGYYSMTSVLLALVSMLQVWFSLIFTKMFWSTKDSEKNLLWWM